jgi:hypothetical protein
VPRLSWRREIRSVILVWRSVVEWCFDFVAEIRVRRFERIRERREERAEERRERYLSC